MLQKRITVKFGKGLTQVFQISVFSDILVVFRYRYRSAVDRLRFGSGCEITQRRGQGYLLTVEGVCTLCVNAFADCFGPSVRVCVCVCVSKVFTIGGAQAVAALAYGTQTIPSVDKITGPGNAYVAAAKRRVFGKVGIDMIAGPSEILVIADGSTPPEWVAMDLFSQAEHDELAQSILLCPDSAYIDRVQGEIDRLLPQMDRREIIAKSLNGRGALIQTSSMKEACEISNRVAPEHLEISSQEPHQWEPLLVHAGAIFMGAYTSESLGDYCAGPNHVLPTSGTARFSSPLGVYDFQKRSSLIEVSRVGAQLLGSIASVLARGEGLQAHALAAEMRLDSKDPDSKSNDKSSEKSSGGSLK